MSDSHNVTEVTDVLPPPTQTKEEAMAGTDEPATPLHPVTRTGPLQRDISVFPYRPLKKGEGIVLRFESGELMHLVKGHQDAFHGTLPRSRLEDPFTICRTPGGIREVGFHGQSLPRRTAALVDEPLWIFPVAWQDRLPRGGYPTRSGLHQDMVLPPSDRNPDERVIRIHLPEAYLRDPERRFPVVYCLDGQNCFDASTSYGGVEWSLDDIALQLETEGEPPCILVGVDNGTTRRMYEYSFCPPPATAKSGRAVGATSATVKVASGESAEPAADAKTGGALVTPASDPPPLPAGGGAKEHLDFILYEVAPLLRQRFRLAPGPGSLVGSSMGGLFGLWASIAHPGAFRSVAVISPSVWWAHEAVLRVPIGDGPRPRVWIDMGTREGKTSVQQFYAACRRLRNLGWTEGEDLRTLLVEGGTHHESAWADRGASILRFLLRA